MFAFVTVSVRRNARNDGRRPVTPAGNGAKSVLKEDVLIRNDSSSVDTDNFGFVSGNHKRRAFVLDSSGPSVGAKAENTLVSKWYHTDID